MPPTKDEDGKDDKQPADPADRGALTLGPTPPGPTLDEVEQGDQAIAILDQLYDAAQDDAIAHDDGPISPAARGLAASAHRMVDDLPRHILAYRQAKDARAGQGQPSDGRPLGPIDTTAIDTARIRAMTRNQLERLINRLYSIRGDTPMVTFDSLTDEELCEMARRLRPERHAQR